MNSNFKKKRRFPKVLIYSAVVLLCLLTELDFIGSGAQIKKVYAASYSAALGVLNRLCGHIVPSSYGGSYKQCYNVPAYYAHTINPRIRLFNGSRAYRIGNDYNWRAWGWRVINQPKLSQVKPGMIINFDGKHSKYFPYAFSAAYGHTAVVKAVDLRSNTITLYEQNINNSPLVVRTGKYYQAGVTTVVIPPGR